MFIDDSKIARKYAGTILFPKLLGMKDSIILGENRAQLDLCVPFATAMKPDIIIIDENLELLVEDDENNTTSATTFTGTQICRDLVAAGVDALLCIRSGNTSPEDVQKYIGAGAHCVICKSFDNTKLAEPLLGGYQRLRAKQLSKKKKKGASTTSDHTGAGSNNSSFPILLLD